MMAKTGAQREAERRQRLRAAGYRSATIWLPGSTMDAVESLAAERDGSKSATVSEVLADAVRALQAEREHARRDKPPAVNKTDAERDRAAWELKQQHPTWSLNRVAEALERAGYERVDKSNVSKAIKRHKARLGEDTGQQGNGAAAVTSDDLRNLQALLRAGENPHMVAGRIDAMLERA